MSRIWEFGPNAPFLRLDDHVTAADTPINARDLQVAHQNYNLLVARRARQPCLTIHQATNSLGGGSGATRTPVELGITGGSQAYDDLRSGDRIISCPVFFPPKCKSLQLVVYGYKSGQDAKIYGSVHDPRAAGEREYSDAITLDSASLGKETVEVRIPDSIQHVGEGWFTMTIETTPSGTDAKTAEAITAVGSDWVEVATATGGVGQVLYVDSRPECGTHRVRAVRTNSSTWWRIFIEDTFDRYVLPDVGDTISLQNSSSLQLASVTLYPNAVTNWWEESP